MNSSLTTMALSPNGQNAYLGDAAANQIDVLDLSQFIIEDSIMVNSPVYDMVVTKDEQFIYASHPAANQVSVVDINTKQVKKEIAIGLMPKTMALIQPKF
ncbi:MAG: YncE family protein [Candidatus Zixiibacteriota bacterium]